jgi:hypothetical protein
MVMGANAPIECGVPLVGDGIMPSCSELKDAPIAKKSSYVIPAKAEALYNSEAGQSSRAWRAQHTT